MSRQARDPISGSWMNIAGAGGADTNFVGSLEEWENLSSAEQARYATVDINDDFNGVPIDTGLDTESTNPVQNQAVAAPIEAIVNQYGSKNLLNNVLSTQTSNGITFTVNSDGSVSVSGTASKTTSFVFSERYPAASTGRKLILKNGNYKASGISDGSEQTYFLNIACTKNSQYYDLGSIYDGENEFTVNGDDSSNESAYIQYSLAIISGTTINTVIYPMIRDARIADDTYVPYAMTNQELTSRINNFIKGTHTFYYVSLGAGWNGYCYGFIPLVNANKHTLTLASVSYFNGSTLTDVTSSFSINVSSIQKDGFAIQCVTSKDYIGKAMIVIVDVS